MPFYGASTISSYVVVVYVGIYRRLTLVRVFPVDAPFQCQKLPEYNLPWEASGFIMEGRERLVRLALRLVRLALR
jgi:hypothetical protein